MHDAGRFLTTANPSPGNCSLNHEEHEEKQGEHEVSSASNCLFSNKIFDALMTFKKTSV
jgi:hypothetical protein